MEKSWRKEVGYGKIGSWGRKALIVGYIRILLAKDPLGYREGLRRWFRGESHWLAAPIRTTVSAAAEYPGTRYWLAHFHDNPLTRRRINAPPLDVKAVYPPRARTKEPRWDRCRKTQWVSAFLGSSTPASTFSGIVSLRSAKKKKKNHFLLLWVNGYRTCDPFFYIFLRPFSFFFFFFLSLRARGSRSSLHGSVVPRMWKKVFCCSDFWYLYKYTY